MQVKINQKNYTVPELGFKHMTQLEDMGFTMDDIIQKRKSFSLVTGFVGIVVGCERDEAERLCEQHILGGGKLDDMVTKFMKAMEESAFFRKLLGIEEKDSKNVKIVDQLEN